jgi:hypothetical protein
MILYLEISQQFVIFNLWIWSRAEVLQTFNSNSCGAKYGKPNYMSLDSF